MLMTFIFVKQPLRYVAKANPIVGFKYTGKYLALFLTRASRLSIFEHHHRTLVETVNKNFFKNIIEGQIELWKECRGESTYTIGLTFPDYGMEGDLSLIFSSNLQKLFTISFTIAPGSLLDIPAEHVIFISRVQGVRDVFDLMQCSTKNLNDISPRILLLEAVQAIAITMGISDIVGICAKEQISSWSNLSVGTSYSDYDHLWQKYGGEIINNQAYRLPVPFVHKPLSMIKRHHRCRAQHRRELRKAIREQICNAFEKKCLVNL
jgi:uncharacterized protein VirK/YbjX